MSKQVDPDLAASKATEIVVAYLSGRSVEPADLPQLVRQVRNALDQGDTGVYVEGATDDLSAVRRPMTPDGVTQDSPGMAPPIPAVPPGMAPPIPAVPIENSITDDVIYSLENGKPYRTLRRHLAVAYGMTPDEYRRKWGLPADYPMAAPSYAKERSNVAKRSGLGKRAKPSARKVGRTRANGPAPAGA